MNRFILKISLLLFCSFPLMSYAQQNTGGSDGVKNTCEVSGGTFTGSEGGNWACCWADWGCYGCVDGNCKIKCHNPRCKKANGLNTISTDQQRLPGLAPTGVMAPIVPKNPKGAKVPATSTGTIKNK